MFDPSFVTFARPARRSSKDHIEADDICARAVIRPDDAINPLSLLRTEIIFNGFRDLICTIRLEHGVYLETTDDLGGLNVPRYKEQRAKSSGGKVRVIFEK